MKIESNVNIWLYEVKWHHTLHLIIFQLGMYHDFDRPDQKDCDGDGIMSYVERPGEKDLIYSAWSACSTNDIKKWFRSTAVSCRTIEYGKAATFRKQRKGFRCELLFMMPQHSLLLSGAL